MLWKLLFCPPFAFSALLFGSDRYREAGVCPQEVNGHERARKCIEVKIGFLTTNIKFRGFREKNLSTNV